MRADIVPGAIFPDYELSDHTAKRRKLSELQAQHPMVLVLSRGGFCPKDRRQAEGLVQLVWSRNSKGLKRRGLQPRMINTDLAVKEPL
jgi:peroxiredoxin